MKTVRRSSKRPGKQSTSKAGSGRNETADSRTADGCDDPLLASYRRSRAVKLRNRIVERHRTHVEEMARILRSRLPRCVDLQDLIHAGMWGLIQAIENFRPELGRRFSPFMRIRVRGAMLDELRNMDYLPRLYRSRLRLREETLLRLRMSLERDPSDAELAEALGVSESRLHQQFALPPAMRPGLRVNRLSGGSEREDAQEMDLVGSLADQAQETPFEAINRRELIAKIESSLEPVEWAVLKLHYLEGMTGKEVARKLRLSASRICQIHGRVLSRLKSKLSSAS